MFDISWGKLVLIGVVALIVIGPKELPAVLRTVGQWMGKIRRMAAEFQGQFQEAMREAEMTDLKKQFDDTAASVTSAFDTTGFKSEMENLIKDKDPTGMTSPATPAATDPTTPPSDPAVAPTDPVALGTAPVTPAPAVEVPMPELPPPVDTSHFAEPAPASSSAPAAPADAGGGKAA